MTQGIGYSAESSENDEHPIVINVKGYNVAISTSCALWSSHETGQRHSNVTVRIDSPDLLLNDRQNSDMTGKFEGAERNWPKRRELMKEVEDYLEGQLGKDRYNYIGSNAGLVIEQKGREHEEANLERRTEHSLGIPALDRLYFGDPLEPAKKMAEKIKGILVRVKHNPELLVSDAVPGKALDAAIDCLREQDCWLDQGAARYNGPRDVQYKGNTYSSPAYFSNHLHVDPQAKYGISGEEFMRGVRQFAINHDLEIGITAREGGKVFYLEATPGSKMRIKDALTAASQPTQGAVTRLNNPPKSNRPDTPNKPDDGSKLG